MYRFFITSGALTGETLTVTGADAHHISHVLRMRPGEDIEAVDETGRVYTCRIEETAPGAAGEAAVTARVLFSEMSGAELKSRLILYQGLPKFEKMELIIQKAVELGASAVVPVSTARTVVKLDAKKAQAKTSRWQAIAEAASKQSKRTVIPEVKPVMTFKEALSDAAKLDRVLIPYEKAEGIGQTKALLDSLKTGESIGVFIGPEGGFDEKEVQAAIGAGAVPLTLGPRILRCETAAITTLSILMFHLTAQEDTD